MHLKMSLVCFYFSFTLFSCVRIFDHGPAESIALQSNPSNGVTYVAADHRLYRLGPDLQQVGEDIILPASVVDRGLALSSDGGTLVVCLVDLSCLVYNTSSLNEGPVRTDINAIGSASDEVAVFASANSYYTGSTDTQRVMLITQLGDTGVLRSFNNNQDFLRNAYINSGLSRAFYGGFVHGGYSYYIVADYEPTSARALRILRVCNSEDNCDTASGCHFNNLYEGSFSCGESTFRDRVCGVSVVNDFAGQTGPVVIVSRCAPGVFQTSSICSLNLNSVNQAMDEKFVSCFYPFGSTKNSTIDLTWAPDVPCGSSNPNHIPNYAYWICAPPTPLGVTVPSTTLVSTKEDIITSLVAVQIDAFSFLFVAIETSSGPYSIHQYYYNVTPGAELNLFMAHSASSKVRQLSWQDGDLFITAATDSQVYQIRFEDCSAYTDCSSCTNYLSISCGWCVVENKCSRQSQCLNSSSTGRWTQEPSNCSVAYVNEHIAVDPAVPLPNLSVHVSPPGLPPPLPGETFSCYLGNDMEQFILEILPGTEYECDMQSFVPLFKGFKAVFDVGFLSSVTNSTFLSTGKLTVYRCPSAVSCRECIYGTNACGWCSLSKQCAYNSTNCANPSDSFQLYTTGSLSGCSVLKNADGFGNSYVHPILFAGNITLQGYNIMAPSNGYKYQCVIGGVQLYTEYVNSQSIVCISNSSQFTLPRANQNVSVLWTGNGTSYPIDIRGNQLTVTLYDCRELASGCSSCVATRLGSPVYQCGWCEESGSCETAQECSGDIITTGDSCPAPVITSFTPVIGHMFDDTVVTVMGTDLGVRFSDIISATIQLGDTLCLPLSESYYIPGRQFACRTIPFNTPGNKTFYISIGGRAGTTTAGVFQAVIPVVTGVSPAVGPVAGGTLVTVTGSHLDIAQAIQTYRAPLPLHFEAYEYSGESLIISPGGLGFLSPESHGPGIAIISVKLSDSNFTSMGGLVFEYMPNPIVTGVSPMNTIPSGGITLTFTGERLDIVQQPVLEIESLPTNCSFSEGSSLTCVTPRVNCSTPPCIYNSSLKFDAFLFHFDISVTPDPGNFTLGTNVTGSDLIVHISGDNLLSVSSDEVLVFVGGTSCSIVSITSEAIFFTPPSQHLLPDEAIVRVVIGENINITLTEPLHYPMISGNNIDIIISLVFGFVALLTLLLIIIACVCRRAGRQKSSVLDSFNFVPQQVEESDFSSSAHNIITPQIERIEMMLPVSMKIPVSQLRLSKSAIGQGEFGIVFKGLLVDWNKVPIQGVAVKTLKGLFSSSDVESMISEIVKMKRFHHEHVMSLIGVCLDAGPGVSIVMPFMVNGSLLDYLKRERDNLDLDDDSEIKQMLSVRKLMLRMCHQICLGMAYLVEQRFVHRDLAARNCMLDSSGRIKVSDFGLAEDIYARGYFRQKDRGNIKLPYKWMAIESLNDVIFTEKTDVWSYGVTVWEVFSCGRIPYPAVGPMSLIELLTQGKRLDRPANSACATEISSMMRKCWRVDPDERPTFAELSSVVENLLFAISDYMELTMVLPGDGLSVDEPPELEDAPVVTMAQSNARTGDLAAVNPIPSTSDSAYECTV